VRCKLARVALRYEVVTRNRAGKERRHEFVSDGALSPGDIMVLEGRNWLVEQVGPKPGADDVSNLVLAKPARYRLRLLHPDGREEIGALRRFRPDAPRLGHAFTTIEDRQPASWQVADERLAIDEGGEPYLDLVAERDYGELEALPDHELEHALAARDAELPAGAEATFSRAEQAGLAVELVALEAGEAPDWEAAERYIDALILEEIEDDLFELCGVDPDRDPRDSWLDAVKERLRTDLELVRADVEGDHDEIEEWDFRGGRVFASVGSLEDEADPESGHGWMCRLVDSGALAAAGFERVRKAELQVEP
jgi:hypothetical protein